MAFTVYFADINKKSNSSYAFPITAQGVKPAQCELKAGCSLLRPVLKIYEGYSNLQLWSTYNVAYIPSFGSRYYRVLNWVYNGKLLEGSLEVDVLATYKSQLSSQYFYVTRTANSTQWNNAVVDTQYPAYTGYTSVQTAYHRNPLSAADNSYGIFIVGVINSSPSFGSVDYYAMSYLNFMDFCTQLLDMQNMGDDTGVPELIAKAAVNPFQYIVSCFWLPFTISDLQTWGYVDNTGQNTIELGYYTVHMNTYSRPFLAGILNIHRTAIDSLTVPQHPQSLTRGGYVRNAPYSKYILDFYPFGSFELDANIVGNISTLVVWYSIDLRTGAGVMKVTDRVVQDPITGEYAAPICFKTVEAQVGIEIPLASIQSKIPQGVGGIISSAVTGVSQFGGFGQLFKALSASVAQGANELSGKLGLGQWDEGTMAAIYENIGAQPLNSQDVSNVATGVAAGSSYAEINGMQGAVSFYHTCPLSLTAYFATLADMDATSFGYPCLKRITLADCSGYSVCSKAEPMLNGATAQELNEVKTLLNSGFIWE